MRQNFFLLLILFLYSCSFQPPSSFTQHSVQKKTLITLDHKFFLIGYDPDYKLPEFVTYELTAEKMRMKQFKRRNNFMADPLLRQKGLAVVGQKDYVGSPYHRGHMAPADDFGWSQESIDATFVMTNMAPQMPNLNSNAWLKLENKVRRWGCGEERITVITGPLLTPDLSRLSSGVAIPKSFYKIIIDETPPRKAIAFIFHQEDRGDVILERMVPVQEAYSKLSLLARPAVAKALPSLKRVPASLDGWKEANCKSNSNKKGGTK